MADDAILLYGAPEHNATILWRTGFSAPDPVVYVEAGERRILVVSPLEYNRAREQAAVEVGNTNDYGWSEARRQHPEVTADAIGIANLLGTLGVTTVRVEPGFPLGLARELEQRDVSVTVDAALYGDGRRRKAPHEVEAVARSQAAAQAAVQVARVMLAAAEVRDGMLFLDDEPLTSARLIGAIEVDLLRRGLSAEGTIATSGPGSANPHATDTGPIAANQPVILDIFPQDKRSHYFGDITRTFVVGEPSAEWKAMYDAVLGAYRQALSLVRPGAAARDVHVAVCQTLYDAGFSTLVDGFHRDGVAEMNHGTGHGVGLEIHEAPRVADAPGLLQEGDVITIEPGLYHPEHGGVRIEDTVAVTADGYRNLTDYPTEWRP